MAQKKSTHDNNKRHILIIIIMSSVASERGLHIQYFAALKAAYIHLLKNIEKRKVLLAPHRVKHSPNVT